MQIDTTVKGREKQRKLANKKIINNRIKEKWKTFTQILENSEVHMGDRDPLDYCTFGEEEAKDTRTFHAYLQIWYGNTCGQQRVSIGGQPHPSPKGRGPASQKLFWT